MMTVAILLAATASTPDMCSADRAATLVGQPGADAGVKASARRIAGNRAIRWIVPGGLVTQDYSETRLNIEIGRDGRVSRVWCG